MNRREFQKISLSASAGFLFLPETNPLDTGTNISQEGIRKIPKTDTHMHLFGLDTLSYSWLTNAPEINKTFLPEDFIAQTKKSHIGKIVFMESGSDSDSLQEVNWVIEQAKKDSRIKAIVASGKIVKNESMEARLEALMETGWVRGIRAGINPDILASSDFVDGMELLAAKKLSFDLLTNPSMYDVLFSALKKVPNTTFILDHLGNPDIKQNDFDSWKKGINQLAQLPNLTCKISGITTRAGKGWTLNMLRPYVHHAIEAFGFDRLVYGGDWPVVLRAGSYLSWSQAFERLTKGFSKDELHKLYHLNADRIYQLD